MRRFKRISITLEEKAAKWARNEASRREMTISGLLGEVLQERMAQDKQRKEQDAEYEQAMRRALSRKPFLPSGVKNLMRDELHDRSRFRC